MIEITRTPELEFALEAVRQAALLVKAVQAEMVSPALTKNDRSPVTIADFASQAAVARLLQGAYPGDALVAEEDSAALRTPAESASLAQVTHFVRRLAPGASSEQVCAWIDHGAGSPARRFWTLDPIDGTKGFLRGDQYAVALALIEEGKVQVALLGCPNLVDGWNPDFEGAGSLAFAVRGQGAWVLPLVGAGLPQPLRVSQIVDPAAARILRSFESGHTDADKIDDLAASLQIQAEPVRMDSQAKYAVLAAGQGELLLRLLSPKRLDYKEKIWDQAAGSLVVEEAGGTVTDLDGKPLDFTAGRELAHNRGLLVSNGLLHQPALGALRAVGA